MKVHEDEGNRTEQRERESSFKTKFLFDPPWIKFPSSGSAFSIVHTKNTTLRKDKLLLLGNLMLYSVYLPLILRNCELEFNNFMGNINIL